MIITAKKKKKTKNLALENFEISLNQDAYILHYGECFVDVRHNVLQRFVFFSPFILLYLPFRRDISITSRQKAKTIFLFSIRRVIRYWKRNHL